MKTLTLLVIASFISIFNALGVEKIEIKAVSYDNAKEKIKIIWSMHASDTSGLDFFIIKKAGNVAVQGQIQYVNVQTITNKTLENKSKIEYKCYLDTVNAAEKKYFAVEAHFKGGKDNISSKLFNPDSENAPGNVVLTGAYDKCTQTVLLHWNAFKPFGTDSLAGYQLLMKASDNDRVITVNFKGQDYILKTGDETSKDTALVFPPAMTIMLATDTFSSYSKNGLFRFNTTLYYIFYIVAKKLDNSSYDCKSNAFKLTFPQDDVLPEALIATGTSVHYDANANPSITASFAMINPPAGKNYMYRILKSSFKDKNFAAVDSAQTTDGQTIVEFTEDLPSFQAYYKMQLVKDGCSQYAMESNVSSYFMITNKSSNSIVSLDWDDYYSFPTIPTDYKVYRIRKDDAGNPTSLELEPTTKTDFSEKFQDIPDKNIQEEICYNVEAIEKANSYGLDLKAQSQNVCVQMSKDIIFDKVLYIGNNCNSRSKNPFVFPGKAFTPEKSTFQLIIFDRWGSKVFETTDYKAGWYGTYPNGTIVPQGAYMYYVKYSGKDKVPAEQKNTILVVCQDAPN